MSYHALSQKHIHVQWYEILECCLLLPNAECGVPNSMSNTIKCPCMTVTSVTATSVTVTSVMPFACPCPATGVQVTQYK